jgi:aspartyl-tRNA(Asn)/glutamyl-tRNA(Gln) amidotransferase subunit A
MTAPFASATTRRLSRRAFVGGAAAAALVAGRESAAQTADPTGLSIAEASRLIRTGELSPLDLTGAYLERIERLNGRVNAYISVTAGLALEQADRLGAELRRGRWRGPLHGIPIALKDNMDTAGIRTTAASGVLANRVPTQDAEVYRRLKEAGAILLGKLNMHEFAYGGTSAISYFGPVRNPWNLDYIPGGSSGGSAAAVSARLCAGALGTDTLASIRLPAAYCGVAGLKATHGLASIRGIVPISESLDHVGPLTRTVADAALMLQAIAGHDPLDPVSIRAQVPSYESAQTMRVSGLRLGLPRRPYFDALDPEITLATDAAIDLLGDLTGGIRDIELPGPPSFEVLLAEASVYHEQYLQDPALRRLYDPVTLERIVAAGGFSAADYINARRELELVRNAIGVVFDEVDLIVTPTTPVMPTTIDDAEIPETATGAESTVRNTAPFNLYGIPTISIPCGFSRFGLPIGLQISGPRLGELDVLALAHAYEQATRWHTQAPPLS